MNILCLLGEPTTDGPIINNSTFETIEEWCSPNGTFPYLYYANWVSSTISLEV